MNDDFTAQAFYSAYEKYSALFGEKKSYPQKARLVQSITSTNTILLEQLSNAKNVQDLDDTLLAAAEQTQGRGRQGRVFYSPNTTGLYFSLIYSRSEEIEDVSFCTAGAAVAISRAIENVCHTEAKIKWVNDIYVRGKKVSGILTEGFLPNGASKLQAVVIGIGINLILDTHGNENLLQNAGGIFTQKSECQIARTELLAASVYELQNALSFPQKTLLEYKNRSILIGKEILVTPLAGVSQQSYPATVLDITEDAGLLVQLSDKSQKVLHSGEVSLHNNRFS